MGNFLIHLNTPIKSVTRLKSRPRALEFVGEFITVAKQSHSIARNIVKIKIRDFWRQDFRHSSNWQHWQHG